MGEIEGEGTPREVGVLENLTVDLAPHKKLGMQILTTEDVKKRKALSSESNLEKAARYMKDFRTNLIDGVELSKSASAARCPESQALVDNFYLKTLAKGIEAVYIQQEEILKRLPLKYQEGGRGA